MSLLKVLEEISKLCDSVRVKVSLGCEHCSSMCSSYPRLFVTLQYFEPFPGPMALHFCPPLPSISHVWSVSSVLTSPPGFTANPLLLCNFPSRPFFQRFVALAQLDPDFLVLLKYFLSVIT